MAPELWKPIKDFPGYEISNFRRVVSPRGILLATSRGAVSLYKGGKRFDRSINRLMAVCWLEKRTYPPPPAPDPAELRKQSAAEVIKLVKAVQQRPLRGQPFKGIEDAIRSTGEEP